MLHAKYLLYKSIAHTSASCSSLVQFEYAAPPVARCDAAHRNNRTPQNAPSPRLPSQQNRAKTNSPYNPLQKQCSMLFFFWLFEVIRKRGARVFSGLRVFYKRPLPWCPLFCSMGFMFCWTHFPCHFLPSRFSNGRCCCCSFSRTHQRSKNFAHNATPIA